MAETEQEVTVPEVEPPKFDPITTDLKVAELGDAISAERTSMIQGVEDFTPLPSVLKFHSKELGITENQFREAAKAQGFDVDYFAREVGRKGRPTSLVIEDLEVQKIPAVATAPEVRKAQARGKAIAQYGYQRAKKGEGRTVEETGVIPDELTDVIEGRDQNYRVLEYDAEIEGTDAVVKPGSKEFEEVMQTTSELLNEDTEDGRVRSELAEKWGQNILLESGLEKYVGSMAAYYTERQAQKRNIDEFDPEYDKLYERNRKRAMREVALMKTNGKWVAPTWMSWEKIFPDQRVSESDDPWLKKAWDRGSRVRIELIGIDGRGEPVFQLTNPVWHLFEMSDVVQSAVAGSLTALGDEDDQRSALERLSEGALTGIENRQTFMDAALATDAARDSTLAAYALGTMGVAATILSPDLLFGAVSASRQVSRTAKALGAVKDFNIKAKTAIPNMAIAASKRAEAEDIVAKAEEAVAAGNIAEARRILTESLPVFEEAQEAEKLVRKRAPGIMDTVDTMDSAIYQRAAEITPEITISGGRKIGKVLGGRFENVESAVHPSMRRREERLRQGTQSLVGYQEYYDTSKIVDELIGIMGDVERGTFRHTRNVLNRVAKVREPARTMLAKGRLSRVDVAEDPELFKAWDDFYTYIDSPAQIPLILSNPEKWVNEATSRFSKLANKSAVDGFDADEAIETVRSALTQAAAASKKIKVDQITDKRQIQKALVGALKSVRANTETRAVSLIFIRDQVAQQALIRAEPVIGRAGAAASKYEEFKDISPMGRQYMKQVKKAFNFTDDEARTAARMLDMRARRWAKETGDTVEAWYMSNFPKEAFKSKAEFLKRMSAAQAPKVKAAIEIPDDIQNEIRLAKNAIKRAERALKKAEKGDDGAAILKAQEKLTKAQQRLQDAEAAKAKFIDEAQDAALSEAIDFKATKVLNPAAFLRRLNQLKKKEGAPAYADVGTKGLSEGYMPGTRYVYRDLIKSSSEYAKRVIDAAGDDATLTLDDLLLPEFKASLVDEIRGKARVPGLMIGDQPLMRALSQMADDGITDAFKVSPEDIRRALGDEDILFQAIDGKNPIFYSRLEQLAQEMPPKVGLNDVVRFLSGRGAKADEIKWTNVQEFLDDAAAQGKKSITKEELLKHLNDNRIIIEDTQIGPLYPNQKFGYFDDARYDAIQAGEVPRPAFPKRVLPGGTIEYREVKLRLPQPKGSQFIVPHWDEADILVFFRATTRRDTQGRRILFIEEIQSDWHQVGRKHGYGAVPIPGAGKLKFQIPDAPFKDTKAWTGLAVKRIMRMAADEGFDGVAFTRGDAVTSIPGISLPKKSAQEYYDKIVPSVVKKHTKAPLGKTRLAGPAEVEGVDFNFVELTPELKKSVGGPQMLFQRGAPRQTEWEMKELGEGLVELTSAEIRAAEGAGLVFKMDGNTLRVQSSELPEAMRGKGIGQELYLRALRHAQEKGFDFASDIAPSPDAIAAYERLIEAGVPLTRKTVEAADGKMVQQFVATADDLADASLDVAPRGGRVLASEPAANTRQAVETLTAEAEAEGIDKLRRTIQDLPEDAQEARDTFKKQFRELFGTYRRQTGYGAENIYAEGHWLHKNNAEEVRETLANVAAGSASPEQYRLLKYLHDNPDELTKVIGDNRSTFSLFFNLRHLEKIKTEAIVEAYEIAQKYGIKGVTADDILSGRFADMVKKAGVPREESGAALYWTDSIRKGAKKAQKRLDDAGVDFTYKLDAPSRAMIVNTLIGKYESSLLSAMKEGRVPPPAPNLEIFLTPTRKKALPRKGAGYDTFGVGAEEDYARFVAEGDRSITLDRLFEGVEAVPTRPAMGVAEPEDVGKFVPSPAGTPKKDLKWYERAEARKRGRGQILRQTLRTRDKLGKAWKTDSGIATISDHEYDVVKEFVAMVGTKRLENVAFAIEPKIRTGMMLNEPLGLYFFGKDVVGISHSAIASGRFVDTTIHELWHGLSQYLPTDTVQDLYKQFARERGQFMRANPEAFDRAGRLADISMAKNQSTYRFSSFDEWVVEKMKDLSIEDASRRLLSKGKGVDPTDLPYAKPWQKALRALSDLVQSHYNQIKAVLGQDVARKTYLDFMRGKYVDQVRDTPLAAAVKITSDDEARAAQRWSEYLDALDADEGVAAAATRMSDETEQFLESMITGPAKTVTPQEFRALASEAPGARRALGERGAEVTTDTPEFKRWFGDSKVVDDAGVPLVVYHGTTGDFDAFKPGKVNYYGDGIYFTDVPEYAGEYTRGRQFGASVEPLEGGNVIPAYVSLRNPLVINGGNFERGVGPLFADIQTTVRRNMADPDYLKSLPPDKRALIDEFMALVDKGDMWTGFPRGRPVRGRNDPQLAMLGNNPYRGLALTDYAKSRGHDGVIVKGAGEYADYSKYDAHQAKLKKDLADVDAAWEKMLEARSERWRLGQQDLDELARMRREVRDASDDLAEEIGADFPEYKVFDEYLVFEPTQAKSKFNRGTFDPTDPRILKQDVDDEIRGATEFFDDGRAVIYALNKPTFATFIHEMGHVMRRDLDEKQMDVIAKWLNETEGVSVAVKGARFDGTAEAVVEAEEKFARAFEEYIRTGKTPQPKLKKVFQQMKDWLVEFYGKVRGLDVTMTPEVRKVFDEMLGNEPARRPLLNSTLKLIKDELTGKALKDKGIQIKTLNEISREATKLGHKIDVDDMTEQLNKSAKADAEARGVPLKEGKGTMTLPGPVYMAGRYPQGKSEFTLDELTDLYVDMLTQARMERGPGPRMALRARAKAVQEMTPTQIIDNIVASDEGSGVKKWVRNMFLGGDAFEDMRNVPEEVRFAANAAARRVEQAIGDSITIVAEGDLTKTMKYITGDTVDFADSGRPAISSGHDMMGSIVLQLRRYFDPDQGPLTSEQVDALTDFVEAIHVRRTGIEFIEDPKKKALVVSAIETMISKSSSNEFIREVFTAAGVRPGTNLKPEIFGKAGPTGQPVSLLETLMYAAGVSRRPPENIGRRAVTRSDLTLSSASQNMNSAEVFADLYKDLRSSNLFKSNPQVANRVVVLIAGHGTADKAMKLWSEMGIAVDAASATAFKKWIAGEALANEAEMSRVLQLYQVHGFSPNYTHGMNLYGMDMYVPAAARQRLAKALARATDPTVAPRLGGDFLEAIGGGEAAAQTGTQMMLAWSYRYQKTRMVRGHFVLKSRYFTMNTFDHFNQMALVAGFRPGFASMLRMLPQNALSNPLGQAIVLAAKTVGYKRAGEDARKILQAVGEKGSRFASKILMGSKWRLDLNDVLEGSDRVFQLGPNAVSAKKLRETMLEEGIFSSFDTSQLGIKIRKSLDMYAKETGDASSSVRTKVADALTAPARVSADIAEAWSERERAGAVMTLMEMGVDARSACRIVIDGLYDYAGSMSKFDRHWIINMVLPFWAFQKNVNRQTFDAVFSARGAYRLGVMRRAYDRGTELISDMMYEDLVDPYGIDVESMKKLEPELYDAYWNVKRELVNHYGSPEEVPDEVHREMMLWVTGMMTNRSMLDDRKYTPIELRRKVMAHGSRFEEYYVPRPKMESRRTYRRIRPGIAVPHAYTKNAKAFIDGIRQTTPDTPYTFVMLPEPAYQAAFHHMSYTAATMILMGKDLVEGPASLVTESDGTEPLTDSFATMSEVFAPQRAPAASELFASWGLEKAAYPQRLDPSLVEIARAHGVEVFETTPVEDPFATEEERKKALEEAREARVEAGIIKQKRYYMSPGLARLVFVNNPIGELNSLLLKKEKTPLQAATLEGQIIKWAEAYVGLDVEEVYGTRTTASERRRAREEGDAEAVYKKAQKGRQKRYRD